MEISQITQLLLEGTWQTIYMVVTSTILAYVLGLPIGILLFTSKKDSIMPNKMINSIFGWIVNIGRSIPFIILMIALMPFTRSIVGKSVGVNAAIVPLVIGAAPFVARLVESSFEELDANLIEAAQSMGATNWQIIKKVMIPETIPSLVRGFAITAITLVGYSAMGGAIGAGGLGDIAMRYGYFQYDYKRMLLTIVILVVLVQVIQIVFNMIVKKIDKKTI